MTKEDLTTKIQELNFKRTEAWKNKNYNYETQLNELIIKLKRDLLIFENH